MTTKRKNMPADVKREIYREAGFRCAIPTCKVPCPSEVAHIVAYSKTQDHNAKNLILLCPNCHTRFDKGDIPRDAIRYYKQNLLLLNNRYIDIERRILEMFVGDKNKNTLQLAAGFEIAYTRLIEDGFLKKIIEESCLQINGYSLDPIILELTDSGREFINNIRSGGLIL